MKNEQISIDEMPGTEIEVIAIQTPGQIEFNYAELKANIQTAIEPYKNMVVTEDKIQEAKKVRAHLNKLTNTVEDRRKQIKKETLLPYETFEAKIKELLGIVAEGTKAIDTQIAAFETAAKENKMKMIQEYFTNLKIDLVPLTKIFDPAWLNATTSTKQWTEAMTKKVQQIEEDIALIKSMTIEDADLMRSFYLDTLNLTKAKEQYDGVQARIKAAQLYAQEKAAKEAARAEEQLIAMEENRVEMPSEYESITEPEKPTQMPMQNIKFILYTTANNIDQVRKFMNAMRIEYIEVE